MNWNNQRDGSKIRREKFLNQRKFTDAMKNIYF